MHDFNSTIFEIQMVEKFLSRKGLTAQAGQSWEDFRSVAIKELLDNALDAAEYASASPVIGIHQNSDIGLNLITVSDNGPGISPDAIDQILNSQTRTMPGVSLVKEGF